MALSPAMSSSTHSRIRRHTRFDCDWSSDVCSSDLMIRISYGIESGEPRVLKIIKKEVALEDMRNAFKMTEEVGIEPACSVMLGLPGDTKESVLKTIDFVASIPEIRYSNFSIANPYPGTEMYGWSLTGKHGIHLLIKGFSEYRRY